MRSFSLVFLVLRALRALWRVGLVRMWPWTAWAMLRAWWHCGASLAFLAEAAALRFPTRTALVDDDGALDFADLRTLYEALAHRLLGESGVRPGRLVAILSRNHRDLVVALLAATRTGADVLLLDPRAPVAVLARSLAPEPPDIILHAAGIELGSIAPGARRIVLGPDVGAGFGRGPLPRNSRPGRVVVLTSGSTGAPKPIGRRPALADVLPVVLGLFDHLPIVLHRPAVLAIPLFHGHGLATLAVALACAAPVHLACKYEIAPLLARGSFPMPPIVVSVPTLLNRWLAAGPGHEPVAAIISGSAPLDPALCRRLLEERGPILFNLYGSSEAGVVSLATPTMLRAAPGTVGAPLPGNHVRLLASDGSTVKHGQVGRICVNGPLIVRADSSGWFDTGDLGFIDDAGRLHVRGRADGMFVSGGENVYPQEVEAHVREHPAVADVAIAVVPDVEFGQRMRAFVVIRPGEHATTGEIRSWLEERLERCKRPRTIDLVAELPRNLLGKIDRRLLQQMAENGT